MMETIATAVIHTTIYLTCGSLFVRSVVSLIKREIRAHRARKAYNNMIDYFNEQLRIMNYETNKLTKQ